MTDFQDPLGRIAAHSAVAYNHPSIDMDTMVDYWRDIYRPEAEALPDGDLATEHQRAVGAVAECEAALKAEDTRVRFGSFERGWDGEEDRRLATIERDALRHRLVRMNGRKLALASETKRRAGR